MRDFGSALRNENQFATPPRERTAQANSERGISVEGFVQLSLGYDDEPFPAFLPYLHQYDLLWRNATTRLRQHGDWKSCFR